MNNSTLQSTTDLYNLFAGKMKRIADIKYACAVLQWDQETYLPAKGAAARARQLATLSETAHDFATEEQLGNILEELVSRSNVDFKQQKNIALTREEYKKQLKYDGTFVREMSETVSAAFYSWVDARKANSFDLFEPALTKLVSLKKTEANILGYEGHAYNALLNEFEKGCTINLLDTVFEEITLPLKNMLAGIKKQPPVDDGFLHAYYPKEQQWKWGMFLVKELGFDLAAGRQDISEHPFTTNFSAKDVRITTRIDEHDFANMTWSCIHETGHALYEQGLPDDDYGLPSGEYTSLSIHESQSRLWENCVGRSYAFWQHYYPLLQQYFPSQLEAVSLDHFYKAINKVQPSFIRTESDELTYHFHVKIRYLIEKEIIEGSLPVKDISGRWNELYRDNLGVTVPDDKRGCLQDVHWSHGSFGYFPTYSLGSFYAAQFWNEAQHNMPSLNTAVAAGDTSMLLQWLRENVHQYGKLYDSEALCRKITGEGLRIKHFINYIKAKYGELYN